jgi:predicted DCC family thiol-disulfide oxidoreductase YuxK
MMDDHRQLVVLFDGLCNLCSDSVQFIIKRDPHAKIKFASLQSEAGKKILISFHLPENELNSMVFVENGRAFTRSSGALRVCRHLSGIWPVFFTLLIVPGFIRNAVYDFVGKNRYKWFGKKNECWIPSPALKKRFLDYGPVSG